MQAFTVVHATQGIVFSGEIDSIEPRNALAQMLQAFGSESEFPAAAFQEGGSEWLYQIEFGGGTQANFLCPNSECCDLYERISSAMELTPEPNSPCAAAINHLSACIDMNYSSLGAKPRADRIWRLALNQGDFGCNGEMGGISLQEDVRGHESVNFEFQNVTWCTTETLLDIIADNGKKPSWWDDDWTEVQDDKGRWAAKGKLAYLLEQRAESE